MKNTIGLICMLVFLQSCDFEFITDSARSYKRIHNESGKNLKLATYTGKEDFVNFYETFSIANGDSIEFELVGNQSPKFYYAPNDSIYIYFDDGKNLVFQKFEYSNKNFLYTAAFSELPQKGKYKNDPIDHYYIKPSHYELAE